MRQEHSLEESEITLFTRFSSAFSHVIRGDLSVITNEVSYLASLMPSRELERVSNRCSQIAGIVSKIAGLQSEEAPVFIDSGELERLFGVERSRVPCSQTIRVDRVRVERFASILRDLMPGVQASIRYPSGAEPLAVILHNRHVPRCIGTYSSWSNFAARELGERSVIDAVVADLIIRAHGWRVVISSEKDRVIGEISIPFAGEPACALVNA